MSDAPAPDTSDRDWEETLADAVDHVVSGEASAEAAAAAQRPKSRKPLAAALGVLLIVVIVWDVSRWNQPPPPLAAEEQGVDLVWIVADVVEEIEAFRDAEGRLPTASDLDGLLDEIVSYTVSGEDFRVVADAGQGEVAFDGSVPLEVWIARAGVGS